jgi:tetratricopeptide (TPR) repeat protein
MSSYALAAVEVALDTLPESYPPGVVFDLQARAYAELANARRVCESHSEADTYLENAKESLALGSGDPGLAARLLAVEAALRIEQRRLPEASELLDRAHDLYLEIGDPHLAGRTLLNRARVAYTGGDPKDVAIGFLERSLALLDRKRDPQLAHTAHHKLILYLTESGDYQRAGEVLLGSGLGEAFAEQPLNRLRLRWVEAKIHAGMNRLDKAEPAFQEVRDGFREHELEYDAALVGFDLAVVWLRQGKDDRVEPLADEMRDTFTRLSLPIEARKALVFLAVVSEMRLASVPVVERTRDFLARLREDPQLVFDVPTALLG